MRVEGFGLGTHKLYISAHCSKTPRHYFCGPYPSLVKYPEPRPSMGTKIHPFLQVAHAL